MDRLKRLSSSGSEKQNEKENLWNILHNRELPKGVQK